MAKNIFELGKSLKLPKMQFHVKKIIYLISRVFLACTFFNFLGRYVLYPRRRDQSPMIHAKVAAKLATVHLHVKIGTSILPLPAASVNFNCNCNYHIFYYFLDFG